MMEDQQQKTDQIAYHFYTKLFSLVHDARVTAESQSLRHDKWFNLESPDSDLFTKDARELYKSMTRHRPPPFELEVVLCIPELSPNQAVVYLPPTSSSTRRPLEPTPELIVLEVWSVSLSGAENAGVTPPPIYKHGMALFRSIYTLLRTLPAWTLYKRIRRRIPARAGALSISLRLRPPSLSSSSSSRSSGSLRLPHHRSQQYPYSTHKTLEFNQTPAPSLLPIPTLTQDFPPVQLPPGTLTFSVTYLTSPCFEIDELESVLSSRFISDDVGGELMNAGEGFVPTLLNKSSPNTTAVSRAPSGTGGGAGSRGSSPPGPVLVHGPGIGARISPAMRSPTAISKEPNESIAERFILPSKGAGVGVISSSPKDPLARLRRESMNSSPHHRPTITTPSPTSSPRQRKLSLNSSPSSSIISQGPFLTTSTTTPSSATHPATASAATPTTTTTSPLPIRRPNLNPFKTNTISSPSNSSPSVSLRSNTQVPPPTSTATAGGGPPPSPLSAHAPPPASLAGQPSSMSSTQSNTHIRHGSISGGRPPPSPSIPPHGGMGERERRLSTLSTISTERPVFPGIAGGEGVGVSSPVPVPPPTRKRYSSSFGHRYVGSLGSNASGNAPAGGSGGNTSAAGGAGGTGTGAGTSGSGSAGGGVQRPETPDVGKPSYLHTNPDEDDISIFVQEIDARKPLIGRAREYQSTRSRSTSRTRTQLPPQIQQSSSTSSNQVIYGPRERDREPLSRLPRTGYGLAGISNWAAYADDHEGLSLRDTEGEDEGRSSPKFTGRYAYAPIERSPLSPNPANQGQRDTGTTATIGGAGGGLSTSPVVSPTMLQMRYQAQQAERRGVSRSPPSTGGGRLSTSPPNVLRLGPHPHSLSRNVIGAGMTGGSSSPSSPPPSNATTTTIPTSPTRFSPRPTSDSRNPTISEAQAQQAYELSTSPTSPARGPMLTNQEEVGERLRRMNEVFLKSLEGISLSGRNGERERRRREREREMEQEREREQLLRERELELERERVGEREGGVRDWNLERERERKYQYGYDDRAGLGLGIFPGPPTPLSPFPPVTPSHASADDINMRHGHMDFATSVEIDIDRGTPPPLRRRSEEEEEEERPLSPLIVGQEGVTTTSGTGGHSFRTFQSPYQPTAAPQSTTSTSSRPRPSYSPHPSPLSPHSPYTGGGGGGASTYSQGSEEVIGRMELSIGGGGSPRDRLVERDGGESLYDRERERERRHGIGGSRFRRF